MRRAAVPGIIHIGGKGLTLSRVLSGHQKEEHVGRREQGPSAPGASRALEPYWQPRRRSRTLCPRSRRGCKQEAASVRRGFPDLESTIEELIAERDKVVVHWRAQATHQGEYMGIPPTGNRVNFRGISIYRIEGGQIAESWGVSDDLGLMRQIGAIPEPGQEAGG